MHAQNNTSNPNQPSWAGEAGPGLVLNTTTRTQIIEIDAQQARLTRLRRAVKWSAGCFESFGVGRPVMVTLTYGPNASWEPEHLPRFLDAAKKFLKRRGEVLRYVWVAELQQRGAVHFHVLIWLPGDLKLPKPDKRGWWPHGATRIEKARCAVGYLCKYASKLQQKNGGFPKGLRLHGCGGLDRSERVHRQHHMLPQWLRDETKPSHRMRRSPGGGWVSRDTGEIFRSPFKVHRIFTRLGVGRTIHVSRVGDI